MTARPAAPLIGVEEAAKAHHVSPETVYAIVRAGHWACIGACAVQHDGSTQWTYVIPRAGFARLLAGELPIVIGKQDERRETPPMIAALRKSA